MKRNMFLIKTDDPELAKELENLKIEGIEIVEPVMQHADWNATFQHIVTFASDKGIELLFIWLATKLINQKGRNTAINKHKIPTDKVELIKLMEIIKEEIKSKNDEPN
jgi:predicted regulator of amino acid metabolism with ACT domain